MFREPRGNYLLNDKSVKLALDLTIINKVTINRKTRKPFMEKIITRISRKNSRKPADGIWISKFDLDYAFGQIHLSRRAIDICSFAVKGETLPATKTF